MTATILTPAPMPSFGFKGFWKCCPIRAAYEERGRRNPSRRATFVKTGVWQEIAKILIAVVDAADGEVTERGKRWQTPSRRFSISSTTEMRGARTQLALLTEIVPLLVRVWFENAGPLDQEAPTRSPT